MSKASRKIPEWHNVSYEIFHNEIVTAYQPAVLKGVFSHWPIVRNGKKSIVELAAYLRRFDSFSPVEIFLGNPSIKGNFSYESGERKFNFERLSETFSSCLDRLLSVIDVESPPSIYMGSAHIADCLPGLIADNPCHLVDPGLLPRLWMGNATVIQPHFDYPDNIACVAAGRRRFTLFPPEQIDNLYVGPIDFTPAGQSISLVSVNAPDYKKYPKFKIAIESSMVAELEPGDAIYIPSLWWHNVEAHDKFNLLVNYWSNPGIGMNSPQDALLHGLLTISNLPEKERMAWKHFFDHYVFHLKENPVAHLPVAARGVLGEMTPENYHNIRRYLYKLMGILR
ncbi:cupin-like domain-containing protein [Cellvibrio sp. pealriver]|uniref:cupin-like domain-containing protein n=1 Tax=Cellvibrio sp. pealriver TaxID=1622269 RepID=UPI0009E36DB3|nr:cupin-like domain-containing protein [Cellvibrio sp. pealriver]